MERTRSEAQRVMTCELEGCTRKASYTRKVAGEWLALCTMHETEHYDDDTEQDTD